MSAETQTPTDELFTTNPLTDLTGFQRDLLVAIKGVEENGSPREGYNYSEPTGQCIRVQAELDGYDEINHGQLYPNLDTLKDKGLIEKVETRPSHERVQAECPGKSRRSRITRSSVAGE